MSYYQKRINTQHIYHHPKEQTTRAVSSDPRGSNQGRDLRPLKVLLMTLLAGIALVKAVDQSAISTAKDISDIAGRYRQALSGEQQIQKKKQKKNNDPFSVSIRRQKRSMPSSLQREEAGDETAHRPPLRTWNTWAGIIN